VHRLGDGGRHGGEGGESAAGVGVEV
jgi:hypothetical protein